MTAINASRGCRLQRVAAASHQHEPLHSSREVKDAQRSLRRATRTSSSRNSWLRSPKKETAKGPTQCSRASCRSRTSTTAGGMPHAARAGSQRQPAVPVYAAQAASPLISMHSASPAIRRPSRPHFWAPRPAPPCQTGLASFLAIQARSAAQPPADTPHSVVFSQSELFKFSHDRPWAAISPQTLSPCSLSSKAAVYQRLI